MNLLLFVFSNEISYLSSALLIKNTHTQGKTRKCEQLQGEQTVSDCLTHRQACSLPVSGAGKAMTTHSHTDTLRLPVVRSRSTVPLGGHILYLRWVVLNKAE